MLGNPRGIVQDDALHFAVERDPLRLIEFLPGLLQQLIHTGIAIERAIDRTGRVQEGKSTLSGSGISAMP